MLLLFWDCDWLLLEHYFGQDTTVTATARHYCYCQIMHWNIEIKAEARDLQQTQSFAVQGVSFAPQYHASAFHGSYRWGNQAAEIWISPTHTPIQFRPSSIGLSHVWTAKRSPVWAKICQQWNWGCSVYVALITTENFLHRRDHKAWGLWTANQHVLKKWGRGTVMRSDTLCICYR
jgi:hypothetical protein